MRLSLKTRISLVLTALAASLLLFGGALWLADTREAIHEEVEAATRVAEQWLAVAARQARDGHPAWSTAALLEHVRATGRLRANALEVVDARGERLYLSPAPTYKAGRAAPAWFARLVEPDFPARRLDAGEVALVLHPDPSRSVLDAWDHLAALAGWGAGLLLALFAAARLALGRALRPLGEVQAALAHTARGDFGRRLPAFGVSELDSLGDSYNRMVETLSATRAENRLLETGRDFAREVHQRLEEERRHIARELHDELGQAITAVRALSGSVIQRAGEDARLKQCGEAILAMTGEMQDGVRAILHRLQPPTAGYPIDQVLSAYCRAWTGRHPDIQLNYDIAPLTGRVDDDTALTLLRLLQESLTNIARHAGASRAEVNLALDADGLHLTVSDNGRGLPQPAVPTGRYGLAGMGERVAALAGRLSLEPAAAGGLRVHATLPCAALAL
jgi:two-component system sensor histidine kinase UhpB